LNRAHPRSLHADPGNLHGFGPQRNVGGDHGGELVRRIASGLIPTAIRGAVACGSFTARDTSPAMRPMIRFGVPAGAIRPVQLSTLKPR
jgi:hypothetical protein